MLLALVAGGIVYEFARGMIDTLSEASGAIRALR